MEYFNDIFDDILNAEVVEELLTDSDNKPLSDVEEDGTFYRFE